MLLAIAALALAPAKITLLFKAGPVTKAVAEIAKSAEVPLYADGGLASEIVCLDVHDVSLEDLKAKLAETIGAVWVDRNGKQVLSRPDWLDAQQRKKDLATKAEAIRKTIEALPEVPEYNVNIVKSMLVQVGDAAGEMGDLNGEGFAGHDKARSRQWNALRNAPAHRLLDRILKRIPPAQLAAMRPDERICYSNEPNASERRLPFDLRPLLDRFKAEQVLFNKTVTAEDTAPWNRMDDHRYFYYDADPECRRILLVVTMSRQTRMPRFELNLLDGEGWKSAVAFTSLASFPVPPTPKEGDSSLEQIRFSPEVVNWPKVGSWLGWPGTYDLQAHQPIQATLEGWMERLLNPERFEPLGFTVTEAMVQYAQSKKLSLVALLPDRALQWPLGAPMTIPVASLPERIETEWRANLKTDGEWLTCRPALLTEGRDERIDRSALGTFLRRVKNERSVTVDGTAIYVIGSKSDQVFETYDHGAPGLAERYQGDFEPKQLTLWYYRSLLRFLGRLSPNQRTSLLAGGTMTVADLGTRAKETMNDLVFSDDLIDRLFTPKDWLNGDAKKIRGHATDQPWEMLPNGIPGSTRIVCTRTRVPVILTDENGSHLLTSWTPTSFGSALAGGYDLSQMRVEVGDANLYQFRFEFRPDVVGETSVKELVPGKRQTYTRVEDMPETVRAEILKGFEDEKKRMEARSRNTTKTTPPPR